MHERGTKSELQKMNQFFKNASLDHLVDCYILALTIRE
jgi:hypothetical protein